MSAPPVTASELRARVEARWREDWERIASFVRQPSISATGEGIARCAELTASLIESAGGDAAIVRTAGHPVVLGRFRGAAGSPRLLRYAMYDVQPVTGQQWIVPPFEAKVVNLPTVGESLVARGAHNSKVAVVAQVLAVETLRDLGLAPVDLTMLVDGEEEVGSPSLGEAIERHLPDLQADGAFSLELGSDGGGRSELAFGCKGLLKLELTAAAGAWGGPSGDIHSCEQALVASPVWALVQALAALVDAGERVSAPGFYDQVSPPSESDERLVGALAASFDEASHLSAVGASRYKVDGTLQEKLRALVFSPTFNISSFHAGHDGEGTSNIVPARARAVVDIRLVPRMTGETVVSVLRKQLEAAGLGHVGIRVLEDTPWARAEAGSAVAAAIGKAQSLLGLTTLPFPMAPYMVPFHTLMRLASGNCAVGSIGHAAGAHGPNEYATIEGIKQHIVGVALFLSLMGLR